MTQTGDMQRAGRRAVLIRSANILHGRRAAWPWSGYRHLMLLGLVLLLSILLVTTGCISYTPYQRSSPRAGTSSARQHAPVRNKARAPVTPPKPVTPPQGEEQGGRIF